MQPPASVLRNAEEEGLPVGAGDMALKSDYLRKHRDLLDEEGPILAPSSGLAAGWGRAGVEGRCWKEQGRRRPGPPPAK